MDITPYIPLVRHAAGQLWRRLPSHVEFDDLLQAGCVGLLEAATRYDPTRGASFATFGRKRAIGAMLDACRADDLLSRRARKRNPELVACQQISHVDTDKMLAEPTHIVDMLGRRWLARSVRDLPSRHRRVLLRSYASTCRATARSEGISESRVCQLRDEALVALRRMAS